MNIDNIKNRFKDHVLTEVLNTEKIKVFDFRNSNGSSNCYQRWIIDRGCLIVRGDNYDAIYWWNNSGITLEFLANCDLGYFNSKCRADKDGNNQKVYEPEYAQEYLKEIAVERIYDECSDEIDEAIKWDEISLSEKLDAVKHIICRELNIDDYELESLFYHENIYDACSFLMDQENEFMFGIDGWEYANNLEKLTMTPKMHLAALRVAFEKYPDAF